MIWGFRTLLSRSVSTFASLQPGLGASSFSHSFATSTTMLSATLSFGNKLGEVGDFNSTVIIGKKCSIEQLVPTILDPLGLSMTPKAVVDAMINSLDSGSGGSSASQFVPLGDSDLVHSLSLASLPNQVNRNDHPMSVHTLTKMASLAGKSKTRLVVLSDDFSVGPLASAIAKAFPLFSKKSQKSSSGNSSEKQVHVVFVGKNGDVVNDDEQLKAAEVVTAGVRLAARLVDSHPELLTTTRFAQEVKDLADKHPNVTMTEIIGEELRERGYGGLYGVGKGATCPPRMIILEYDGGSAADETVALVGKGIVYDTGGLSLKSRTGMCGMKHDMGGAAGMVGGFFSAVELGVRKKVTCILCLAENAIGPDAFRNDDILEMYSGKTVEINNCDAEGRLVLAEGVAHATKHIKDLDLVVDMATLTGAQLVATGKKHAAVLCNKQALEERAVAAGLHSGDLCYPVLYEPQLMEEFKSEVADMKNSVKDRSNAQTSCAGHFIEAHLDESYQGGWLHCDMAGPATNGQRGTGYGVGLILSLLGATGF